MNKLLFLAMFFGSISVAMQQPQREYNSTATNALREVLTRSDIGNLNPEELQEVLQNIRGLVISGANPNMRPISFYTPLFFAIAHYDQDPSLIKFLLERGADPRWLNFPKISPLNFALQVRNLDAVGLLLDYMNIKAVFTNNETLLTDAIRNREVIVPLLLARGVDFQTKRRLQVWPPAVAQPTQLDLDPLGLAVLLSKTNVAQALIEAGADVNQIYTGNRTLLMWAVARNNKELVKYLLDHGAWETADQKNTQSKTALDIAKEKGYTEIAKLISTQEKL